MATATELPAAKAPTPAGPAPVEPRFVLQGVPWDLYERMVEGLGESHVRMTYDRGTLELMSPSPEHDRPSRNFILVVHTLAEARGMDFTALGSTTLRREVLDKGLEPDECFYIAHWEAVCGLKRLDLDAVPPPDLAVEIDITNSSLDRMAIYAALGVPEVWRYDGQVLSFLSLGPDRAYHRVDRSPNFPEFSAGDLAPWIERALDESATRWVRSMRAWARRHLRRRP